MQHRNRQRRPGASTARGSPAPKPRTSLRGLPAGGSAFLPAFQAHFSPELHPARPPHSRGRARGVWAGRVHTESDQGTRAFDKLGELLSPRRPGGRPQLPRKVLSLEAKVALLSPRASVCSSLTAIACRGVCVQASPRVEPCWTQCPNI